MDILQIASVCGGIITIISLVKLVVEPFQNAIKENNKAMLFLQETIQTLSYDLKESKKDRENIHLILDRHEERFDKHEERINQAEDDLIVHREQLKNLNK